MKPFTSQNEKEKNNFCLTLFEVVSSKSGKIALTIHDLALLFNVISSHKISMSPIGLPEPIQRGF